MTENFWTSIVSLLYANHWKKKSNGLIFRYLDLKVWSLRLLKNVFHDVGASKKFQFDWL